MKLREANATLDASGVCIAALIAYPDLRTATKYISPKYTVKATRQFPHDKRARANTYIVTMGVPNYLERKFIKAALKAGEPFPVKKVQFKYWPKKRK